MSDVLCMSVLSLISLMLGLVIVFTLGLIEVLTLGLIRVVTLLIIKSELCICAECSPVV